MGGLSLMVRKFEKEAPRPFDRLIVEVLPELPELSGRPGELLERLESAHAKLEVGELQRDALVELAYLYHANGFVPQAESCYLGLESFETQNALWPYLLGVLKSDRRDQSVVAGHFERVLELDPDFVMVNLRLGKSYFASGLFEEARAAYEKHLFDHPDDPWALVAFGHLAMVEDDLDEAVSHLEMARLVEPGIEAVYELLPDVYVSRGEVAKARSVRSEGESKGLYSFFPDERVQVLGDYCYDPDRLIVYASGARENGDPEVALALLERALALGSENEAAIRELLEIIGQLER